MMGASGDGDSFGDGLAAAARSIIADARRALADSELSDAEAVLIGPHRVVQVEC